jgi:hypothetical protein
LHPLRRAAAQNLSGPTWDSGQSGSPRPLREDSSRPAPNGNRVSSASGRKTVIKKLALACLLALVPGAAPADGPPPDTRVLISAYTYFPGDDDVSLIAGDQVVTALIIRSGGTITLVNDDVNGLAHSMTADAVDASETPLFDSSLVQPNESAAVDRLTALAPGVYGFHCRAHEWTMHGYLQIIAS